jgi:hypothetical protein
MFSRSINSKSPEELLQRRSFLTKAGGVGLAAAAAMMLPAKGMAETPSGATLDNTSGDTAVQIITAALIAEDLATTFYYNGLRGEVMQDPALAGPGGTATKPSKTSDIGNILYLRAALTEEANHATLLRTTLSTAPWSSDPYQTFYFPTGSFDTISAFTSLLDSLENAFIGAYLAATLEFAQMATDSRAHDVAQVNPLGGYYSAPELQRFSQIAASIMGVESEHRALGRVISNAPPTANELNYEQLGGIATVYNGSASAVAALTPFLTAGSGMTAFSLHEAIAGVQGYGLTTTTGSYPPMPKS